MKISSHLRDKHDYSLSESVAYSPQRMIEIHDITHRETECNHTHNEESGG